MDVSLVPQIAPLNWIILYEVTLVSLIIIRWIIYHEKKLKVYNKIPQDKRTINENLTKRIINIVENQYKSLYWKW